jgi:dTDP-3-amino-3,4,6-trideoxy-alpha-D-glucose transaminase
MSIPAHQVSTQVPFMDLARQHAPIAGELRAAFDRVLDASAFVLGEEVDRFERRFAAFCGVRHCVAVGSGTAALTIMLEAAGIGRGDEVIVPAHTFVASALAVLHAQATPVCADVEPGTGLLDPAATEAAIGPRTAAILSVHLYGQVCDIGDLQGLCRRRGLALFEDAAQAQGATYRGRRAGGLGHAGAFSFYPSKNLGALGDGGALCTDDDELADRARRLRNLGRSGDAVHALPGYNARLDGLQAAFLGVKLDRLEVWNQTRRGIAAWYRRGLEDVQLLEEKPDSPCVYHVFPIRVADREGLASALRERGIKTGIHYPLALPDQPLLRSLAATETPVARDWARRELSLPIFPELTTAELERVAETVVRALGEQAP